MSRRHFLKTSVSSAELQGIQHCADAAGMTVAAFARTALGRAVDGVALEHTIKQALQMSTENSLRGLDQSIEEIRQLTRLIASHLNAQAAARVTANINQSHKGNAQ